VTGLFDVHTNRVVVTQDNVRKNGIRWGRSIGLRAVGFPDAKADLDAKSLGANNTMTSG